MDVNDIIDIKEKLKAFLSKYEDNINESLENDIKMRLEVENELYFLALSILERTKKYLYYD